MGNSIFPLQSDGGALISKLSNQIHANRFGLRSLVAEPKKQSSSNAVILVVEDNDALRNGLQLMMETDGFAVFSAMHGLDALEKMKSTCPDLILCDISMPVMDGIAFFQAVRARPEWIAIPFIFLTAHAGREEIFEGKKLGAEDYLVKPVNRQELLTTIRSRLNRSQQLLLVQLKQAYEASLIMLSNAIELRDQYTRGHVERVKNYSLMIARNMGLNYSQLNALQFGSILHDIGKIYIRETILKKPGPLDNEEWVEMKRHPNIGAELIKDIEYLAMAIPVIRHHHERWDGMGYPLGLAGEEIPLEARIVAVADSFDAMSTVRVYQPTCDPQEAYSRILLGSGSQFDPNVVEAFKEAWAEINPSIE